ncbi:MAG: chemotaxis protein CheA [Bacteroidetes bacterium]|nr:MAG: chemotaxis protein CheA [Bacteroidota bacterium]
MNDLINSFLEEANELIIDLEDSLLTLEETPNDKDAVHRVFRVMHTLKGSGGMFGFNAVSDFTHHLESIYYKIRSGELIVTKEILTLTLKSVDLLKELLKSPDKIPDNVQLNYTSLVNEIKSVSSGKKKEETKEPIVQTEAKEEIPNGIATYYIHFEPNAEILQNGTNPLYLIDELTALGSSYVIVNTQKIPEIDELKIDDCYVSWEIILATKAEVGDIMDVFIFVEDESNIDIQKLSSFNLLQYPEFENAIKDFEEKKLLINTLQLQSLGKKLIKENPPVEEDQTINSEEEQIIEKKPEPIKEAVAPQEKKQKEPKVQQAAPPRPSKVTNSFSTIRVSSQKIETLMNLVSEMVTSQARLNLLAEDIKRPELSDAVESLEKLTRQLRDNAFEISLIPIESMLTRFKRLIRDLSAEVKKEVHFTVEGTDTELDKTIIENLSDPLLHLFRNALDHGIEDRETRKKNGKPEIGNIKLKAFYSGTNVYIQIIDDGGGINPEVIRKKAIQKGLIAEDDILSKNAIIDLITLPGFSTADTITGISGRGVGMDVVKRNIQKIQGELLIDSTLNVGTTFTLKLPLTLSIIDGLIVNIDKTPYIIPIPVINKIRPVSHTEITKAFNNTMIIDSEQIPFIYLRQRFNVDSKAPDKEMVIVVNYENQRMGIIIDNVEKQAQVVVKSIGKQFHQHDIISGASIMGNGQVALVLDTNKIINSIDKTKNSTKNIAL